METTSSETSNAAWPWWLLAALVLLGGAGSALVIGRTRRRHAWDTDLEVAESEMAWLARELLPALQAAGNTEAIAGGWQVEAARVGATEDRLTGLSSAAPDDHRKARSRALRDAVRTARHEVEGLLLSDDVTAARLGLATIATTLTDVLTPIDPAD